VTRALGGTNRARIGVALLVHGVVSQSKLPYTSGNAAAGGFVDAGGPYRAPPDLLGGLSHGDLLRGPGHPG
jgi:hypothetical protein